VNPKPGVDIDTAQTNVPQFSDVPVPQGFSVRKGNLEAYTEEAGSYRAGRQRYEGSARPIDANAYYEERMPNHGWVLVERGTDDARRLFTTWKKAHTTTRIEIDQDSRRAVTTIEVRVGTSLDPNFRP